MQRIVSAKVTVQPFISYIHKPAKNALAIFVDVPLIGEPILYKNKRLSNFA